MYQEYDSELSFATDAWMSPNHTAFVAVTVHLVHEGKLLAMVLDVVELATVCYNDIMNDIPDRNTMYNSPTVA